MTTPDTRVASDGLPATEIGEWSLEKHQRLERYVDISRAVRRQFLSGAGATYIDLFCSYGRSFVEGTDSEIAGSPVLAFEKSRTKGSSFSAVHIADINAAAVDAAKRRLTLLGANVQTEVGPASSSVQLIAEKLNPNALHIAFLDPFNLEALPFNVIETLAKLKRMDMLIHVSALDLKRNLDRYMTDVGGTLDSFAPGWRSNVDQNANIAAIRSQILNHWLGLIRALDLAPSQGIESVAGKNNQGLYWLVFASRHERAAEFWDKIRNISGQGRLFGF